MPRLVVVSSGALNWPHRKPYDMLGREPGWDVHIVAPARVPLVDGRDQVCDEPREGAAYTLHKLETSGSRSGRSSWFRGLGPLLLRLRPELVFVEFDPGSLPILHAWAASRAWGARVFAYTPENILRDRWADMRDNAASLRVREAVRDAIVAGFGAAGTAASAGLACMNEEGARIYAEDWGWKKPIKVVPLGTDLELFRPMDVAPLRRSLGLEGGFVVGYFGRVVPDKGVKLLVDALAQLPPSFRMLLDMFFEPGSYAEEVVRRAEELGVKDRLVTFDVPHGEVSRYMNCCDALVLPSLSKPRWKEQFGRVLPEAMACGIPVVGSSSGNIPAMIGDAGIIVPEGDPRAIAAALRSLADDRDLYARLAAAGRKRVEEHLSIQVQVKRLKELFLGAS
jgi:glycosyltransferase involved in cell wall biosynthesis